MTQKSTNPQQQNFKQLPQLQPLSLSQLDGVAGGPISIPDKAGTGVRGSVANQRGESCDARDLWAAQPGAVLYCRLVVPASKSLV